MQDRGKIPLSYPDSGSVEFRAYAANCSACHAPPMPSRHRAEEWPSVIARMQVHRTEQRLPAIAEEDLQRLRRYLVEHARE
ncbi:MAG: hypothetical protein D6773_12255 [Alphaproteobacteria bacterium]|nr:MAG: hypothetical protein D6773_12255 [Alphaproteobacteria bacterium]